MLKTGRVYKIISTQGNECYVGSTFNTTRDRFQSHKRNFKSWKAGKAANNMAYKLFDKFGVENCKMILIKEYKVIDRAHLETKELLWIKKLKAINEREPCGGLLKKEYNRLYCKQWYEENKEDQKQKNKEYNKQWREEHKEYNKQYYEAHKNGISENKKQKIKCECNFYISNGNIQRHKKTLKHQKYLESLSS